MQKEIIFHDIDQNTELWLSLRMGKFTASTFASLFSTPSTDSYKKVIYRTAYERFAFDKTESFSNAYMERGHELEPHAVDAYEMKTFADVTNGGFYEYNEWVGASPDGMVGDDGQIQVKCPAYNTAIGYIISNKIPPVYIKQIQGEMMCTGRAWCDFVSYHPGLPLLVIRIERDEEFIGELLKKIETAIADVKKVLDVLNSA